MWGAAIGGIAGPLFDRNRGTANCERLPSNSIGRCGTSSSRHSRTCFTSTARAASHAEQGSGKDTGRNDCRVRIRRGEGCIGRTAVSGAEGL